MEMRKILMVAAAMVGLAGAGAPPRVEDYDWHDGTKLTVEGKGFAETTGPYTRLPQWAKEKASGAVWGMSVHSTGVNVRFVPKAKKICFRWRVTDPRKADGWMGPTAMTGLDVYGFEEGKGWRFAANPRYFMHGAGNEGIFSMGWTPGKPCMVYLPLRSKVELFEVGVEKGGTIEPMKRHGVERRVVHYGTSIVHGGCVSRPGMAFANMEGRLADVEVVNHGYSGAGRMELGMCEVVASMDAALYILDCDWNMSVDMQERNYEAFVRELRRRRPDAHILLCGGCTQFESPRAQEKFAKGVFDKLKAEGGKAWERLHFLSGVEMLPKDGEATFDFCHPNDWGSMQMGRVYADKIKAILGGQ